jgi:hypothetical protein
MGFTELINPISTSFTKDLTMILPSSAMPKFLWTTRLLDSTLIRRWYTKKCLGILPFLTLAVEVKSVEHTRMTRS